MRLRTTWDLAVLIIFFAVSSEALFAAPTITSLSPTSGAVGTPVTITGTNFGATQDTSTVTFNGMPATTIASWGATSIVATVPTGATTGSLVVTVGGVASNSVGFTIGATSFTVTRSLATARMFHTATLLNSGMVLVAGGVDGFTYNTISSAELYRPATATFSTTGNLNTGRIFNTSTLLTNTQVLVAGGSDSNWNQIGSAELYNPASGTFTFTGSLNTARTSHTATLLNNGKVLIAGGWDSNGDYITTDAATSELYDPTTGVFTSTGSLNTARDTHTATLLNNGTVLIAGGFDGNSNTLSSAEIYDPVAGTFTLTGSLNIGRAVHTATLLNNGMVLIAGGYDINGNAVASGGLYDPTTGNFTVTGSLNTPRYDGAQGTLLSNGMVLLAGGQDNSGNTLASTELYDPATGTFTVAASMNTTRQSLTTTLLNDGQVLVTAGMDYYANVLNSAELYQPSTLTPTGLVSIGVGPSNPAVSVGAAQLFTATGTFSDNSTQTLDSVTWTSSDTTIATISNDSSDRGKAVAVAPGSPTVSACTGSVCGSTTMTVLGPPTITSLSPTSGTVGTPVTITGTNFGSTQGTSTVTFNGVAATPSSWNTTSIVVPVPGGATSGNVVVTVGGVPSNGIVMTISASPQVAQVQPANGSANVPLNGRVVARFTQPLQLSNTSALGLLQGTTSVAGTTALSNDGLSLTFAPSQNLTSLTVYTVVVQDLSGGNAPPFQSSFTTGSTTNTVTPQVVQTSPPSGATSVPINSPVMAQFTAPMDPSTLTPQTFTITDSVTGLAVPGVVQVDPTGLTASFVPHSLLGVGRTFYASLSSSIQDTSGNSLSGGATYVSFTTSFVPDSQGPSVIGVSPSNGVSAVPLNSLVVLEFDKPLDPISISNGFQVVSGGQAVSGGIALSDGDKRITFTPVSALSANTMYTIVITPQLTDLASLPLVNPGTFTFTTGTVSDTTAPTVISLSPAYNSAGAPTNAVVQLQFSKPLNPLTVTNSTFYVSPNTTYIPVAGTVSVSVDGQTATFTPSAQLETFANYVVIATNGITDMEGQGLSGLESFFTTGQGTVTTGPTVGMVSPQNGSSGVPVNAKVDVVLSEAVSAASVGSSAITVSAGGMPVAGAISLSSDRMTLTFTASSLLAVSTGYTATVSGFTDEAGNGVAPFTSSFTTGTSGVANTTGPTVVSVNPENGASAVPVSRPIVLTFNEAIDGTTVNDATVPVSVSGYSGVLAGSYTLDGTGTVVTFTPLSALPGNATVVVQANSGLLDLSGNPSSSFYSTFTTGAGTDTTAPAVTMVTPQNGATEIGSNAVAVLTFSKSLNPSTVNTNNFALLANGSALPMEISISADNRVVTLNGNVLPASSTVTAVATSGVTDLSGNALANYESQFTTAAVNMPAPTVVSQRPGNGATGVPLSASVVLYMSEAMNASSVQAALHVSQNGMAVSGTTQVTDNGQVVQFTPSIPWQPSALLQVFLTPTAQSADGNSVNNYQASFTAAANATTTAPAVVGTNPAYGYGGPTNVVMDFAFNEALDPAALTPDTVACSQNGTWFQSGASLLNGGTVLQIVPRLPLLANTPTNCRLGSGIVGMNGLALSQYSSNSLSFTTGAGPDTVVPTITTISPPNGTSNVGDDAEVRVVFSKPINPLTVNASTIQLNGGGVTVVPDSISFSNNNQSVLLVPHAPLPDGTQMTLTISGVTDVAGNAVVAQTTQFTTGTGPDVIPPVVVKTSPIQGSTSVPLNAVVVLQVSEPIDPGSVNGSTFSIVDPTTGQSVAGAYSVSADGQTITFVPAGPLAISRNYSVSFASRGITDMAGNLLTASSGVYNFTFTTGTTASTSAPQVVGVSPASGMAGVPINAQAVIQFNEPVDGAKLGGVVLSTGSGAVNVTQGLTNGNQTLTLVPELPLLPGTPYTLTIAGVQDLSGNVLVSPGTVNFTTGSGADLVGPKVASVTPAYNSTGVPTNAVIQVQFSKQVDPLTVTNATFQVYPANTLIAVAGTIAVSENGQTATLTPSESLDSSTLYAIQLTNGILDLEGQGLSYSSSYFTTASGTTTLPPTLDQLYPTSASVGASITLSGTYFGASQGSSSVTFNGVPATTSSWTDTQIMALIPNGATTGNIVVTVNGAPSNGVMFTVVAAPSISGISPGSGTAGTPITITGTSLGDAQDSIVVYFNGNYATATPTSASETSLVVTVPTNAVSGNVRVSVNGGNYSNAVDFTVIPTPNISSMTPTSGVAGTPVNIYGTNFGVTQGSSTLNFNGVPVSVTSWSDSVIQAVSPSNVSTGPVTVVENSVPSNTNIVFTVTNPAISSLSPPSGAIGATITLNGSGFSTAGLTTQVMFNAIAVNGNPNANGTSLTVTVPQNASSGPVTVEVGGVTSNSLPFTVEQPPTIASVSPSTGPFGLDGTAESVTITGSGFGATQSNSMVNFYGSSTAPTIASWGDTAISLWVPADATTGPLTVQVGSLIATAPSWFYVNAVTQLKDSLGNQTQYSSAIQGGSWFASASQGPGCSTCSIRGNITNVSDANGNTLSSTDDLGNTTSYTYDSSDNMTSVSKPLNSATTATTSYTYNSFAEVLTSTDPLGNTTTNTYDTKGNLFSVTAPVPNGNTAASVTQFQYDTKGELIQITDPNGNVTTLTYTLAGLIATIKDAKQNLTTYQYDAQGDRTAVIDALHNQTSFSYDAMHRLTGITYPDHSTVSFTYDVRGRRITSTDQNNRTTTYTYDDADRLTAVTDPASNTTQYAYDTEDNLLSITDANGHTTQFAYNARGWVTQTTFPSSLAEYYAYDLVGNLLSKTDRKGQTIQYVYDALYRLAQKTYPDSTNVEYVYDLAGKVLQVNDPTGAYGFAYDNMGRLIGTTTQYAFLTGPTFTNTYTYDAASNRTSLTAPDGSATAYGYDSLNRLNGLANSWAGIFDFGYDALSRRTSLTRPNGVNTSYSYDSLSHLLSVLHQAGANTVDGASYTYDAAGNRMSKGNYLNGITSNYSYDPLYELTQVTQGGSTTESYSYDAVGNRLSSLGMSSYQYNPSNELTSDSLGSYSYDANGNTLTDASGKSYTWDFENRLVSATVQGTGTVTFKYDPLGRRIYKSSSGGTSIYVYDNDNLIEETNATGAVVARYSQGLNTDEPLAMLRSGATSFYNIDALSTVTSLSNAAGSLAQTYTYDSFGKQTAASGSLTNPFQYTGREFDSETNLYYYRARYYDPTEGRFLNEDPVRWAVGNTSFYPYVRNSPGTFNDPSGLYPNKTPEPSGGPPMPVPGQPNLPWVWNPNPGDSRGGTYRPDGWSGPDQPSVNWDPNDGGHWDLKPGNADPTERFDRWGNPIAPEQAHRKPGPGCNPSSPPKRFQLPDITPVVEIGIFTGIIYTVIRLGPVFVF